MKIRNQIEGIQKSTGETVTDIEQISDVIANIDEIVGTIAAAVEEQSTAMKEIALNISQASSGVKEVNQNVSQSSKATEDIARDISEVNQAAAEMTNNSSHVNLSADELSGLAEKINTMVGSLKCNLSCSNYIWGAALSLFSSNPFTLSKRQTMWPLT